MGGTRLGYREIDAVLTGTGSTEGITAGGHVTHSKVEHMAAPTEVANGKALANPEPSTPTLGVILGRQSTSVAFGAKRASSDSRYAPNV